MGKKGKAPDMNLPIWFDGQNINEALFCEEFLHERRIIFANGAFFTPDGRVTDDLPLRGEIYDKLKFCAVNNIPRKITNILEVLKLDHKIAKFVLAVRRNYSDDVSFISVKAFAKKAEFVRDYLVQGTKVMVEGEIVTGSYENKETGKKVYTTELFADRIEFAGWRTSMAAGSRHGSSMGCAWC